MTTRSITVEMLSRRVGIGTARLLRLLADDVERGIVQQHQDGSYSLTAEAERLHGRDLRAITLDGRAEQ